MEQIPYRRLVAALALLSAWAALLTTSSSSWAERQFKLPPAWDHALYLSMSLRFHRSWDEGGLGALARTIEAEPSAVAPLFPLSTLPFYSAFGESREAAQLTLAPYLFLLLLATALLTASSGASFSTIALSVFLISTFTGVVNFSREYMMDLPAAAAATLGLWTLSRRGPGLLAGLLAGIALLTKVLSGIFIAGPLVYSLRAAGWRKMPLFAAACVATAGLWLFFHFANVFQYIRDYGFGEGSIPFRAASHPGYYFMVLVTQGVGWFFAFVLIASGILGRRRAGPVAFLLVWLGSGYALLSILPNKGGERYVLALLPPLAVLGARAIAGIEPASVRKAFVVLALAAGTFNYAGITWPFAASFWTHDHFSPFPHAMPLAARELRGWPTADVLNALGDLRAKTPEPASVAIFLQSTRGLDDDAFVEATYRAWLRREPDPSGRTAYIKGLAVKSRGEIIESILQSEEFRVRPLQVAVVPDHRVFNAATLQYLAEAERRPLRFRRAVNGGDLEGADAALVKEGGAQGPWPESRPSLEVLEALEGTDRDGPAYPCPDGSRVRVLLLSK